MLDYKEYVANGFGEFQEFASPGVAVGYVEHLMDCSNAERDLRWVRKCGQE